jgi:serine/threonine-protein kinase
VTSGFAAVPADRRPFGRYTLLHEIATGGMATVYLAHYGGLAGFEKLVAIKRIHDGLARSRTFRQMFIDEARLAARISHPNVAQVIELGAVDGQYFIAMEYVEGESLNSLLARGPLPHVVAARIVSQAAEGLHAAHELRDSEGAALNVVHRDVTPGNILVSYAGAVKVVDFGVAKARGNAPTTGDGMIKGKFAYLAPEQLGVDDSRRIDRRADIFTLGTVLWEATTHQRLFLGASDRQTIEKILQLPIPRPSQCVRDYPAELESIAMRALQRRPQDRYPTALEMHLDLERFLRRSQAPVLATDVAALMERTFADTIAEKRAWMQRCRELIVECETAAATAEFGTTPTPRTPPLHFEPTMLLRRRPSTLSAAVGEVRARFGARARFGSRRWALLAASCLLAAALGGGLVLVASGRDGQRPAARPPQPEPQPPLIEVAISASPATASISLDGRRVTNPYRDLLRAREHAVVEISAPGHRSRRLELPLGSNISWHVVLVANPPPAAAPPPDPAAAKPSVKPQRKQIARPRSPQAPTVRGLFRNPYRE